MEIIKKVEKQPRGVYCGAIGILVPKGPSIFNVAIRTLQMKGTKAIYGVGGGITWDSNWVAEYEETKQKAAGSARVRRIGRQLPAVLCHLRLLQDRKSTRLNSSH